MKKLSILFWAACLTLVFSCKEDTPVTLEPVDSKTSTTGEFWDYTIPKNSEISTKGTGGGSKLQLVPIAVKDLQNMKTSRGFQEKVTKYGLPLWNLSASFTDSKGIKTLTVPIASREKESVTAMLVVNYMFNDELFKYVVVERSNYPKATGRNSGKKLMPAKAWEGLFAAYDYEIFDKEGSVKFSKTPSKKKKSSSDPSVKVWLYVANGYDCTKAYNPWDQTWSDPVCTPNYDWMWFPDGQDPNGNEAPQGEGNSGGNGTPGGGPQSTGFTSSMVNFMTFVDNKPAVDPQKYKNCFNDGKVASSYQMTLYIEQPTLNSDNQWAVVGWGTTAGIFSLPTVDATLLYGHAFIGFKKTNTDGTSVTQVMGFYPGAVVDGNTQTYDGLIKDDGNVHYNVSYSVPVTETNFNNALTRVVSDAAADYRLTNLWGSEYNCTDAAIAWMNVGGAGLQQWQARTVFLNTPGDYGQVLRGLGGTGTNGQYAPGSKGDCN